MSYHEIDIFDDEAKANEKAREHEAAGRQNITVTPKPGLDALIVYDNRNEKSKVVLDADGPPSLFIVESDGD